MEPSGGIDLLLTQPTLGAPHPWRFVEPQRWQLDADVDLTDLAEAARRVNQPCPALAHFGATPVMAAGTAVNADLFVDLEALGLLTIESTPTNSTNIVRALAAGISVSPLAEIAQLITCGVDDANLGHPSTQRADSLDMALDLAAGALGSTAAATSSGTTTFALRSRHQGGEAWEPAIVLAGAPNDAGDEAVEGDLLNLTQSAGRGLAVVVAHAIAGAKWVLREDATSWTLYPLGLEVIPVGLTAADLQSVKALLDESDEPLLTPVSVIGAMRLAGRHHDYGLETSRSNRGSSPIGR